MVLSETLGGLLMLFDTRGHIFERQIIMLRVRWYRSHKLGYRDLEEMAIERGLEVDHTTIIAG
jgi:transposase-like protein